MDGGVGGRVPRHQVGEGDVSPAEGVEGFEPLAEPLSRGEPWRHARRVAGRE
jgi:hypothetical protein